MKLSKSVLFKMMGGDVVVKRGLIALSALAMLSASSIVSASYGVYINEIDNNSKVPAKFICIGDKSIIEADLHPGEEFTFMNPPEIVKDVSVNIVCSINDANKVTYVLSWANATTIAFHGTNQNNFQARVYPLKGGAYVKALISSSSAFTLAPN